MERQLFTRGETIHRTIQNHGTHKIEHVLLLLLLLPPPPPPQVTANGVVPGGSGTTIHTKHKITHTLKTIHNTQNYKHNKVHVLHTLKAQNGNFNLTKNLK
jgi:hypothetical protein